jgi:ribosomal protein S18 acetylase RimI-like enzyme
MKIRDFRPTDAPACLALFDSNTPDYYHPNERAFFAAFIASGHYLPERLHKLGAPAGHLYVVTRGDDCVACGGWYLDGDLANLSFGTVHRAHHRRGIGAFLLGARLNAIRDDGRATAVRVRTTPSVQGFFERAGFRIVADGNTRGIVDEVPLVELRRATFMAA